MEQLLTCLAVSMTALVSAPATQWHQSYRDALEEVHRLDKPLFVVISPGSSDYGEMVNAGPFLNQHVEQTLTNNYVRLHIDTDTEAGQSLAERFEVSRLPHLVVIDRSGTRQVYHRSGEHSAREVASLLTTHRRAFRDPNRQQRTVAYQSTAQPRNGNRATIRNGRQPANQNYENGWSAPANGWSNGNGRWSSSYGYGSAYGSSWGWGGGGGAAYCFT